MTIYVTYNAIEARKITLILQWLQFIRFVELIRLLGANCTAITPLNQCTLITVVAVIYYSLSVLFDVVQITASVPLVAGLPSSGILVDLVEYLLVHAANVSHGVRLLSSQVLRFFVALIETLRFFRFESRKVAEAAVVVARVRLRHWP